MHVTNVAIERMARGQQCTVNGMCHAVSEGYNRGTLYWLSRHNVAPNYPKQLVLLVKKDGDSYDVTEYTQVDSVYRINRTRPHSLLTYTSMAKQYSGYMVHEVSVITMSYHAMDTCDEPVKLFHVMTFDNRQGDVVLLPRDSNNNFSICPQQRTSIGAYRTFFIGERMADLSKI